MSQKPISLRINARTYQKIKNIAEKDNRSINNTIDTILKMVVGKAETKVVMFNKTLIQAILDE